MEGDEHGEQITSISSRLSIEDTSEIPESDRDTSSSDQSDEETAGASSRVYNFETNKMSRKAETEAFCDCHRRGLEKECACGEEDSYFEWSWDGESKSAASFIKEDSREVMFHIDYSCGTAAVRGNSPMKHDQYYWEIKMTTPVYGTDMMVGVCTERVDLNKWRHTFCSMIGQDSESWGLSYMGTKQHRNSKGLFSSKYGQGSIIGVHLDMWQGTLSFYQNRRPLGVAYTGLQGKELYPIVSSTAARSGMKVIRSCSFPTSLQFMCCQALRKVIPSHLDVLNVIDLPPGLKDFLKNNIRWLLQPCPPAAGFGEKAQNQSRKRTRPEETTEEDDVEKAGPSSSKKSLC